MKTLFTVTALLLLFSAPCLWAGNCRLVVHEITKDGDKTLKVEEKDAFDRDDCKVIAEERRLSSLSDEDIKEAKVTFGYRGPAILAQPSSPVDIVR